MFRIGDFSKLNGQVGQGAALLRRVGAAQNLLASTATPATATTQPRYCRDSTAFWLSKNWAFHWERLSICWKATCRWTVRGIATEQAG